MASAFVRAASVLLYEVGTVPGFQVEAWELGAFSAVPTTFCRIGGLLVEPGVRRSAAGAETDCRAAIAAVPICGTCADLFAILCLYGVVGAIDWPVQKRGGRSVLELSADRHSMAVQYAALLYAGDVVGRFQQRNRADGHGAILVA